MAIFTYKGIDGRGKELSGELTAENPIIAKQKIKGLGILLVSISEKNTASAKKEITFGSAVSVADVAIMTRQLATLIKAKIPLVEALSALIDQADNDRLRITLSEVRQKVNEGSALAKALGDYPKIFNNIYINMVEAGEASGTLDVVLLRLADFTEATVALRNKIQGAMMYPMIMAVFGLVMMNIIFIVVIPKITKIFVSMKKDIPLMTKISMNISSFMVNNWWMVIIGLFLTFFIVRKYIRTPSGQRRWHSLQLKIPILKELVVMINVSRFCSTLATLLQSSVPILTSMNIVINLIPHVLMKEALVKAKAAVSEGSSLTGPLIESRLFPPLVTHMIRLGERSGELEPMLKIISQNYEEQVNVKLGGLTSILEPIMMLCLGCAVGFIVFSVIIPMMQLSSIH